MSRTKILVISGLSICAGAIPFMPLTPEMTLFGLVMFLGVNLVIALHENGDR